MTTPAPEFTVKLRDFESQILYFNGMYKLPTAPYPTMDKVALHQAELLCKINLHPTYKGAIISRLNHFKKILSDELAEVDDIVEKLEASGPQETESYSELELLTDLADWLGDIQVYCASEMAKYGIPIKETLSIIMSSNFSKLDAQGNPIYDDTGKVLKGPFYWKPEPKIRAMLEQTIKENKK